MNFLNKFSIKFKTYMLVGLSVLVAITLSIVSNSGLNIIQSQIDELICANNIERYAYRAILEDKNYLLNANGSLVNREYAKEAFIKSQRAVENIYKTLDKMNGDSTKAIINAIKEYDVNYKRGIYLLKGLDKESKILQKEGDNITFEIQQYVEAKRADIKLELSQNTIEKINTGSNIWHYTYVIRADEKRYLLSQDAKLLNKFKQNYTFMMSELERLKTMSDTVFEHEKIAMFFASAKNYEKAIYKWIEYNKEHVTVVIPNTNKLSSIIIQESLSIRNNSLIDIYEKRELIVGVLIVVTFLTVLFGIVFGALISRSISKVIRNFQTGLLDFFSYLDLQKNSAKQIDVESKDEIAVMANVVNENIVKIEEVMENKLAQMKIKDEHMLNQSRLAQMGEMISMIAHQWRQPLSVISAISINMQIKIFELRIYDLTTQKGREEMEEYTLKNLYKINEFVKHLSKTIDDFRNFFKPDKVRTSFSLPALIEKTLNIGEHLLETQRVEVIKNYDTDLSEINSFENEIMQVILSILNNGVDALMQNNIKKPRIYIDIKESKSGSQVISIEDNAGGIPDEIISKIFDQYFSTKDKNGTGLGLYIAQIIITEHCDGAISVQNTSRGACFKIELKNSTKN
ncbi:sensor histidine kinase [Sulfurimonas sp. CS5]|uniref:sensor histidine kinase n=1 Tax=Sulfurimonas sp. CS5 TaxID=3391145 RepID=UPI0039E9697D